ncbi:MerR family transcriptional regulator [candidate division WOR-3 bacterium]|nr:MerR family transcriptional regulator [candidate division WOR-3 bacterium]
MKKLYYSIREVSELLKEKQSTLRFWEKEFEELSPRRTAGGRRLYSESDIKLLERIQYFLHEAGFSIEGARRSLLGKEPGIGILERLENIKKILE